jgi:hypothetical protein
MTIKRTAKSVIETVGQVTGAAAIAKAVVEVHDSALERLVDVAEQQGISQTKIDAALRVYGKARKVEALMSLLLPVIPNHVLLRALAGKHRQPESVAELRGRKKAEELTEGEKRGRE